MDGFTAGIEAIHDSFEGQLLVDRGRVVDHLIELWPVTEGSVRVAVEELIGRYRHVRLVETAELMAQLDMLVALSEAESDDEVFLLDPIG